MAIIKGKPDAGSGGKRGHSNMDHWMHTDEVKASAKKGRRVEAKARIAAEMAEHTTASQQFHCPRCGASWRIPFSLSDSVREAVVALIRRDSMIAALQKLFSAGFDLRDSKATISHVPRVSGK